MTEKCPVVVRIWKKAGTPILIFPNWKEHNGMVMMWESVGQHGSGDAAGVVRQTRPATDEETRKIVNEYEMYYHCPLEVFKKMPPRNRRI